MNVNQTTKKTNNKERQKVRQPVFPVGLLSAGRKCLVVGGGKIGLRKIGLLLDAKADVTVISPEVKDEISCLAASGELTLVERLFEPHDVAGCFIVFAATSDRTVNRGVLEICREQGIYACSIDDSWPEGDFVTPASLRKDGVVISVSTGGKSCRRSRLIKNSMSRHLEMVESADLVVIGTSHNYLSLEEREPLHLVGQRFQEAGAMLMQLWGVHEFAILNTCNRIELHAVIGQADGLEMAILKILGFDRLGADDFYIKRGLKAFQHTSVMTAGLLSQTPGEKHIVAQMKDTMKTALAQAWAGTMLQQWQSSILHVSKDIRGATEGLLRDWEIEDLCRQYLIAECPDWSSRQVLVLGAGVVGAGLVEHLGKSGQRVDWFYHRNRPVIPAGCGDNVQLLGMNQLRDRLPHAEAIVCATSSQGHVLHMGHAPFLNLETETLIVDLAMPRNVDSQLDGISDSVKVIDLDDLKHWYRRKIVNLAKIFEISTGIVAEHKDMYERLINSFQGGNAS